MRLKIGVLGAAASISLLIISPLPTKGSDGERARGRIADPEHG